MVAYELIITWKDGSETQRSVSPSRLLIQGSSDIKEDAKDAIEQIYGERPADVWVCLHRCAEGLADQSDQSLKNNCNHFADFAKAGMIEGAKPNTHNPNIPNRWEYTNPSEGHRP